MCVKNPSRSWPARTCASDVSEKKAAIFGSKYEIAAVTATAAAPSWASRLVNSVLPLDDDWLAADDRAATVSAPANPNFMRRLQAGAVPSLTGRPYGRGWHWVCSGG